jgi:formylglycine-generating enzyme required for sulfatase activity
VRWATTADPPRRRPAPGPNENLPISWVNWYEAYAFCIWDGGFLPTQAEWEYAAAGGAQQRQYPWGSTDPGTNNQYAIYNFCDFSDNCADGRPPNIPTTYAPVGSAPLGAGLWGQFDLGGDIDQWQLDVATGFTTPCVDCAGVSGTFEQYRRFKGGSWSDPEDTLMPSFGFYGWWPPARYAAGIRCARAP